MAPILLAVLSDENFLGRKENNMNNIASKRRFMFFRGGKLVYTGVVPAAAGVLPHNVVEWAYGKLKSVGIPPEKDDVFVFKDKAFKLTFVSRTCGIK